MNTNTGDRKMSQKEMMTEAVRIARMEARMIGEDAPTGAYIEAFNAALKAEYNRLKGLNEKKS